MKHRKMKMTISRFALAGQVGVETVRFYQRQGLLPIPKSREKNYREYDHYLLQRLRFIRRAKTAGFSLAEIKELINLDPVTERKKIQHIASDRLQQLITKINELQDIVSSLSQLIHECHHISGNNQCPIIFYLTELDPAA